jgi:hypothetical protein
VTVARTRNVRVSGEHYVDLELWHTATYLLDIGANRTRGQSHPLLAASVFAFFAFEAYLNEVGRRLAPDVWTKERTFFAKGKYQGTLGKFRYLSELTGYHYSASRRPFQTVRHLATVRDKLAHGRVETFDVRTSLKRADSVGTTPRLREWGELSFAKRAVADIKALADGLMAAAKARCGEWAAGYRSSAFTGISSIGGVDLEEGDA